MKRANSQKKVSALLIVMFVLAWAAMKLSLPALPTLEHVFHTSPSAMKLSVSLFFISFAASQTIWGAVGDHFARKQVVIGGLLIAMLGTVIVITSTSVTVYIVGRCLEGIGVAAMSPLGRAIISDTFDHIGMARLLALISCITGVMPAASPIVGGFILVGLGWRFIFIFFLILLLLYLIWFCFGFQETHHKTDQPFSIVSMLKHYYSILKHPLFWGYAICYAMFSGAMLGYYGAMPFWYVQQWHIPEQYYAFLAIFSVSAYVLSLITARHLVKIMATERLLQYALLLGVLVSMLSLVFSFLHIVSVAVLVLVMTLFAFAAGAVFPCSNVGAMQYFKKSASMIGALLTTVMFLSAGIFSWIESHFTVMTLWPVSFLLLSVSIVALLVNRLCISIK